MKELVTQFAFESTNLKATLDLFVKLVDKCFKESEGGDAKVVHAKRAPSERNIFIGHCMKEEKKDMKACSDEYKVKHPK